MSRYVRRYLTGEKLVCNSMCYFVVFLLVVVGQWKSIVENDGCNRCGARMTTDSVGSKSSSCCHCTDGFTFSNVSQSCACLPGHQVDVISDVCRECDINTYNSDVGSVCVSCVPTRGTVGHASTSLSDCICLKGYYQLPKSSHNDSCIDCPTGAVCSGSDRSPIAAPGYYQSVDDKYVFVSCANAEACIGNDDCARGYTGFACGSWYVSMMSMTSCVVRSAITNTKVHAIRVMALPSYWSISL